MCVRACVLACVCVCECSQVCETVCECVTYHVCVCARACVRPYLSVCLCDLLDSLATFNLIYSRVWPRREDNRSPKDSAFIHCTFRSLFFSRSSGRFFLALKYHPTAHSLFICFNAAVKVTQHLTDPILANYTNDMFLTCPMSSKTNAKTCIGHILC